LEGYKYRQCEAEGLAEEDEEWLMKEIMEKAVMMSKVVYNLKRENLTIDEVKVRVGPRSRKKEDATKEDAT